MKQTIHVQGYMPTQWTVCDICGDIVRAPNGYSITPEDRIKGMTLVDLTTGEIEYVPPLRQYAGRSRKSE